jgi:hypothetical protein
MSFAIASKVDEEFHLQPLASVLSPYGFFHLCFSLSIEKLVPAVPHESLKQNRAAYTPDVTYAVIRFPVDLS